MWTKRVRSLRRKYSEHKRGAGYRGIAFELTYSQWLKIWERSGKLSERGRNGQQYVMARKGDAGPYAVGNVRIITARQNSSEGHLGRQLPPFTLEHRQKISRAQKGVPNGPMPLAQRKKIARSLTGKTRSAEQCRNIALARTGKRWTLEQRKRMSETWHARRSV